MKDLIGWQKVFKFTFVQNLKSKSFIISTIVISIILLGAILLTGLLPVLAGMDDSDNHGAPDPDNPDSDIAAQVYIADFSGVTTADDYKDLLSTQLGKELIVADNKETAAEYKTKVENAETAAVYVEISRGEAGTVVTVGTPKEFYVSDAETIMELVTGQYKLAELSKMGLTYEQSCQALQPVNSTVITLGDEDGSDELNPAEMVINTMLPMLSSLILFMLIFTYGQLVAQSIAQEKTGKVMELLLTSVRPLSIIVGKILAMGCLAFLQFFIFIAAGGSGALISAPLTMMINNSDQLPEQYNELIDAAGKAFSGINPLTVILVIIVFIAGFVLYSLIAGLFGASVSRTEDLNNAMQPYAIIGIIGFYLAYFPTMMELDGEVSSMSYFSYFFPLSSPFSLPGAIITGKLDILQALIGCVVLIICVVLMAILVSRVYEQVIFHTGNRLKIKDILGLAKAK